jgi:hypothetical protein
MGEERVAGGDVLVSEAQPGQISWVSPFTLTLTKTHSHTEFQMLIRAVFSCVVLSKVGSGFNKVRGSGSRRAKNGIEN